jgi:hypothetical protein
VGVGVQTFACDGFGVVMQEARIKQLPDHEAEPASGVEVVHIRQTVGIDPRQEWHDIGKIRKILPVQNDATGTGHCDQVDQQVG